MENRGKKKGSTCTTLMLFLDDTVLQNCDSNSVGELLSKKCIEPILTNLGACEKSTKSSTFLQKRTFTFSTVKINCSHDNLAFIK